LKEKKRKIGEGGGLLGLSNPSQLALLDPRLRAPVSCARLPALLRSFDHLVKGRIQSGMAELALRGGRLFFAGPAKFSCAGLASSDCVETLGLCYTAIVPNKQSGAIV
jgi:hypothetical protein